MVLFLLHGLLIGALISIPVGPVNVICLYQTMQNGRMYGFKSTIGATIADTIFAVIASLGVNVFINFIVNNRTVFELSSGLVIIVFGIILFTINPGKKIPSKKDGVSQNIGNYFRSFFLTISNPLTVLFLVAYLANFKPSDLVFDASMAGAFVLGVVMGSLTWFYSLSGIVARYKENLKLNHLTWINRVCAFMLCLSGFVILIKSVVM